MFKQAKKAKKLTGLQERFCLEYVIDLNGTQAIIRAGSRSKYPEAIARQMLRKSTVWQRIEKLKAGGAERAEIKQDTVIEAFAEIGFLDPAEMLDENDALLAVRSMPLAVRRAISGFEVEELYEGTGKDRKWVGRLKKLKFCPKNDALDKLAKHLGLFEKDNKQRSQPPQPDQELDNLTVEELLIVRRRLVKITGGNGEKTVIDSGGNGNGDAHSRADRQAISSEDQGS